MQGFAPGAPLMMEAHANHLLLGRNWERILPQKLLEQWKKFSPAGEINADLSLRLRRPRLAARLDRPVVDVSLTYYKFPYRLERASGLMTLKDGHLTLELVGGTRVSRFTWSAVSTIRATISPVKSRSKARIFLSTKSCSTRWPKETHMPRDRPTPAECCGRLNPEGAFDFELHNRRDDPNAKECRTSLVVGLNRATVRYEKFPYPISNIRGKLVMCRQPLDLPRFGRD